MTKQTSDKFYELSDETIKSFNRIFNAKAFPIKLSVSFIGNSKQKTMIKLSKVSPENEFLYDKQIFVRINEELFDQFDDISRSILFEQEIDKVHVDSNTGKVKLGKLTLVTSPELITKYGLKEVARANQLEDLTVQQVADGRNEQFV